MLFAAALFAFYFMVGMIVVFIFWAVKVRFGDSSELDPNSFVVRIFKKKRVVESKVMDQGALARKLLLSVSASISEHRVAIETAVESRRQAVEELERITAEIARNLKDVEERPDIGKLDLLADRLFESPKYPNENPPEAEKSSPTEFNPS